MKLYLTPTTPYGRVVRVALLETGLDARVETSFVKTRVPGCMVNDLNPTGKVPTLQTDDGVCLSETRLICEYLDSLHDGVPVVAASPSLDERALEGVTTGFVDGVSVWVRELHRPEGDRSASILEQERARAERCVAWLDSRVARLEATSRFVQLQAFVALEVLDQRVPGEHWQPGSALAAWYQRCLEAPAVIAMQAHTA